MAPRIKNISADEFQRLFKAPEIQKPGLSVSDAINLQNAIETRRTNELKQKAEFAKLERELSNQERVAKGLTDPFLAKIQDIESKLSEAENLPTDTQVSGQESTIPGQALLEGIQGPVEGVNVASPRPELLGETGALDPAREQAGQQTRALQSEVDTIAGLAQSGNFKEAIALARPDIKTASGAVPRSIEAFWVGKAARGELTIDEAVLEIQKAEPSTIKFTDNQGREGIFNKVTEETTFLKSEKKGEGDGKIKSTLINFTPNEKTAIKAARKQFNSSEFVKKQGMVLKEFSKIASLVESNPAGAIGPLRTQISKVVAGEVGRLTDEDIMRNVPTVDLWPSIIQAKDKILSGKISEVGVERYKVLLEVLGKEMATSLNTELGDIVEDVAEFEIEGEADRKLLRKTIGRGTTPFLDKFFVDKLADAPDDIDKMTLEQVNAAIAAEENR